MCNTFGTVLGLNRSPCGTAKCLPAPPSLLNQGKSCGHSQLHARGVNDFRHVFATHLQLSLEKLCEARQAHWAAFVRAAALPRVLCAPRREAGRVEAVLT